MLSSTHRVIVDIFLVISIPMDGSELEIQLEKAQSVTSLRDECFRTSPTMFQFILYMFKKKFLLSLIYDVLRKL